jgi:hypothetical protein
LEHSQWKRTTKFGDDVKKEKREERLIDKKVTPGGKN